MRCLSKCKVSLFLCVLGCLFVCFCNWGSGGPETPIMCEITWARYSIQFLKHWAMARGIQKLVSKILKFPKHDNRSFSMFFLQHDFGSTKTDSASRIIYDIFYCFKQGKSIERYGIII